MSERLELLRPYLSCYKRRFAVLDFGAGINVPAIGPEIAREFDAVVTCAEKNIEYPEPSPRTMWLKKEFGAEELAAMSECEHFDVVLAFNILHWFPDTWKHVAETLLNMGNHLFIQIPKVEDVGAVNAVLLPQMTDYLNHHMRIIGETVQFPRHMARPIFYRYQPTTVLTRTHVDAHDGSAATLIESTDSQSIASMKDEYFVKEWMPGINLYNFFRWNGISPSREFVIERLRAYPLPGVKHGDITLHNFIFDGADVHLIDGYESWGGDDRQAMEATIEAALKCR